MTRMGRGQRHYKVYYTPPAIFFRRKDTTSRHIHIHPGIREEYTCTVCIRRLRFGRWNPKRREKNPGCIHRVRAYTPSRRLGWKDFWDNMRSGGITARRCDPTPGGDIGVGWEDVTLKGTEQFSVSGICGRLGKTRMSSNDSEIHDFPPREVELSATVV
jgi:hypothetical protein